MKKYYLSFYHLLYWYRARVTLISCRKPNFRQRHSILPMMLPYVTLQFYMLMQVTPMMEL